MGSLKKGAGGGSAIGVRVAILCALASVGAGILPSGAAFGRPARGPRLVAAFDGGMPSPAARAALSRLDLRLARPVFKGHEDWNIWELRARGTEARRGAVARLEHAPGVRWAELDASLSYDSTDPASSPLAGTPFGPLAAPDWRADPAAAGCQLPTAPRRKAAPAAPLAASPAPRRARRVRRRPASCTPGSAGGLDAGQANDPLFCNEPNGPYYSEEWNNFCFVPQTQLASVVAGASARAALRAGPATRARGTSARRGRAR